MLQSQFGVPGQTDSVFTTTNEFLWGGDVSKIHVLMTSSVVSGAARDAGNSPVTVFRSGMIMGTIDASGKLLQCDPTASDGSQSPSGINGVELLMIDPLTGANTDRVIPLVVEAPVKPSALFILGAAFVGHAYEYLMRSKLAALGFKMDDDLNGYKAGVNSRITTKATDYVVVAADNATQFQAKTADCDFTLPAIQAGLKFSFLQTADFELKVTSAEGNNIVVGGDASATAITFTTAGQQVGAQVEVEGQLVDGVLKWVLTIPPAPFGTGVATLAFALTT